MEAKKTTFKTKKNIKKQTMKTSRKHGPQNKKRGKGARKKTPIFL